MQQRAPRVRSRSLVLAALALALGGTMLAGACGGGDDTAADTPEGRGEQLADDRGCVACHGVAGVGGVGPKWTGLFGSERTLDSGEVVVADGPYLERSIAQPAAQVVEGYTVVMPENDLSASEIADVVAYIESLS